MSVPSQDQAETEQVTLPSSIPSDESGQAADPGRNSARETVSDARVQAISSARYKVTFTASAELREKLGRLRELTRSSHHGGDLAAIIEEAITEKLERVEARCLGKVKSRPKSMADTDTSPGSRHIPAAVTRAVSERDADRCTFVNATDKRCRERAGLEFHHDKPFALGGGRPQPVQYSTSVRHTMLSLRRRPTDHGRSIAIAERECTRREIRRGLLFRVSSVFRAGGFERFPNKSH